MVTETPSGTLPGRMAAAIAELRRRPISVTDKGFGCLAARQVVTAESLGRQRPVMFDAFTMPLLVLRETALRTNVDAMAAYCAAAGAELAPHGKTAMAPQLVARQLAAGCWAVTAATIGQVQAFRAFGVPRLLLANELVDSAGIRWLAAEMAADPEFECCVYVDSIAGVTLLDRQLAASGAVRPLPVLVELGYPGGRTGCRTVDEGMAVARAAASAASLRLVGAAGFEGSIGHDTGPATVGAVIRYCGELRALSESLRASRLVSGQGIVSAGGSAYFDVVLREVANDRRRADAPVLVLRSGCYLFHDNGTYAAVTPASRGDEGAPRLSAALELWAQVVSRPEPGRALACAGRRDVSFDQGLPVPLRVRDPAGRTTGAAGMRVTRLDDQHAYLDVPDGHDVGPGDWVCFGVSHPCTTLDKWRVIPVVDDNDRVIDAIHTFF